MDVGGDENGDKWEQSSSHEVGEVKKKLAYCFLFRDLNVAMIKPGFAMMLLHVCTKCIFLFKISF